MIVTTTSEINFGFEIKFDNDVIFKVSQLPEKFVFQPGGAGGFFISRESRDFLSHRKFVASDTKGNEIASLSPKLTHTVLTVGGNKSYPVKFKAKGWIVIPFGRYAYEISELGIKFDVRERFFSCVITTDEKSSDETRLAIIVLLHFARIYQWRESG